VIENQLSTFKGLGLLKEDELKNEKVKKSLHRAVAVLNSEEVKASRRLFNALQVAWKKVGVRVETSPALEIIGAPPGVVSGVSPVSTFETAET
jgi:hypothetical protein